MKRLIIVLGMLAGFLQYAHGQNNTSCKIVIYRENYIKGAHITHDLFMNDSLIATITNNYFYSYTVKPGEYKFRVGTFQYTTVHLTAEPGQTYYLRFSLNRQSGVAIPVIAFVDEEYAKSQMNNATVKQRDKRNGLVTRHFNNRIGINIGVGAGFSNIPMVTTTTGQNSTISFGGGTAIGLKFGHQYNDHFEMAYGLMYEFSELTPTIQNADITFGRGFVSATPSYILPLHGGKMRLKFGAGGDYYFSSKFKINTAQLQGGINETWSYKKTFGFHIAVNYEVQFSDRWSLSVGLKGYGVNFEYDRGIHYIDELLKPDGSGIDLTTGFYYHF